MRVIRTQSETDIELILLNSHCTKFIKDLVCHNVHKIVNFKKNDKKKCVITIVFGKIKTAINVELMSYQKTYFNGDKNLSFSSIHQNILCHYFENNINS